MPKFEIKPTDSPEIAKATFDKESDYKVVYLNSDAMKKPRLLHKLQADRLISNKKATLVKDASLETREEETSVSKVSKK